MNKLDIALMMLNSMIIGIQTNSSIPVQASELLAIKFLIEKHKEENLNEKAP
jgi:hypothetical protein